MGGDVAVRAVHRPRQPGVTAFAAGTPKYCAENDLRSGPAAIPVCLEQISRFDFWNSFQENPFWGRSKAADFLKSILQMM
jgi:hypothetical protein